MTVTPSRAARLDAGLTLDAVARRLDLTVDYLRRCECRQRWPWHLANRLARLYACSLNAFLPTAHRATGRGSICLEGRRAKRPSRR
jgi:hypothetical protein